MKKSFLIKVAFIIAILVVVVIFCVRKDIFRKTYVSIQLNKMYQIDVSTRSVDIYEKDNICNAYISLDNGIYFTAEINSRGKIIKDNYINVYYADEVVNDLNNKLTDITKDCFTLYNLADIYYSPEFNTIHSYEEYLDGLSGRANVKVYIRESVSDEDIKRMTKVFAESNVNALVVRVDSQNFEKIYNSELVYISDLKQVLVDMGYDKKSIDTENIEQREILDLLIYDTAKSYDQAWKKLSYNAGSKSVCVYAEHGQGYKEMSLDDYLK